MSADEFRCIVINLHQLVNPVSHIIDLETSTVRKINCADHSLGAASVGIACHGQNNSTALIPLHFAISNGIVVIYVLAFINLDHYILTIEKLDVNLVHVMYQSLKNFLIQLYKLMLLGEFQIAHRAGSLRKLTHNQLRLIRQAKVSRRHSAK